MEENQDMNLEQQEEQQEQETKTYSQEEVFAMLQKESDRRVQQALKSKKRNMRRNFLFLNWMSNREKQPKKICVFKNWKKNCVNLT